MRKVKLYFLLLFTTSLAALGQEQELALAEVYDYAPDFSYEEIERRYNNLGLEIDIAFNDRVDAFINYFTVRERGYTREMLRRKEVYFPIFEKYLAIFVLQLKCMNKAKIR